jgi:ferredoxin
VERCQFNALNLDIQLEIDVQRCVGCGSCVLVCPEDALALTLRPPAEIPAVPASNEEWMAVRARSRGIELIE